MHFTKNDIENMDQVRRIKYINSVSGIKPANLLGTISNGGLTNLAIFSSVFHLGSEPAILGFITRPTGEIQRHTYENIMQNGQYTINHVHHTFVKNAHYTSAKFSRDESEFEQCGLTEEFLPGFNAPFVKESTFKLGMVFKEAIDIKLNGTILVIGEIAHLILPPEAIDTEDDIDLADCNGVGISGLNTYYALQKIARYPYAHAHEKPNFK